MQIHSWGINPAEHREPGAADRKGFRVLDAGLAGPVSALLFTALKEASPSSLSALLGIAEALR